MIYGQEPNGGAETLAECAVVRMISALKNNQIDPSHPIDEQLINSVFWSNNHQGLFGFTHKDVATTGSKGWTDNGVFQLSGIKVFDPATGKTAYLAGPGEQCSKPAKYGYRWGDVEEVSQLKLIAQPAPAVMVSPSPSLMTSKYVASVAQEQKDIQTRQE